MKKLNLIFLLGWIAFIGTKAQDSKDPVLADFTYQLEFDFTGEVTSTLDSTFIVYCVIDASKLKDFEKLIVKRGKSLEKLNEQQIDFTDKSKVTKKMGKLRIELGKAGEDISYMEIEALHKNGEKVKIMNNQK